MIHSLAGGELGNHQILDFAKVELLEGIRKGDICFYISKVSDLKAGDEVVVPFGVNNNLIKAKVLRIDKNVSSFSAPVPIKKAKEIFKKV